MSSPQPPTSKSALPQAEGTSSGDLSSGESTPERTGPCLDSVLRLFSTRAHECPDSVAVQGPRQALTYEQLLHRSHRWARALLQAGIHPEDPVALLAHRNLDFVAAVLGVLQAGGSLLLLDAEAPHKRNQNLLRRVQPPFWIDLSHSSQSPELRHPLHRRGLEIHPVPGRVPPELPRLSPDHRAGLVFTSGSTGKPRAVEGRLGPLSHYLPWLQERFDLRPTDRFSCLASLVHDPIQRDLFTPLSLGATLVLPNPNHLLRPGYLAHWLATERVTVAQLTPSMAQLIGAHARAPAPHLRCLFLAGEPLTRDQVRRIRSWAPKAEVIQLYGTTETQRALSFHPVLETKAAGESASVPIGRGFPGVQLLLRHRGREVEVGSVGEIHVRSLHLARAYLDDPANTAERFLPDPTDRRPGERIYRTGDLGRRRPDGAVECLGRLDRQVQVRGVRVEPAEIEDVLATHPKVERSTVVLRRQGLTAFFVPRGQAPTSQKLRTFVRRFLPEAMVPSRFVALDTLPLLASGKVDRRSLETRELPKSSTGSTGLTPREEVLLEIWTDVLAAPIQIEDPPKTPWPTTPRP